MIRLRKILLCNSFYFILLILGVCFLFYSLCQSSNSQYSLHTKEVEAVVTNYLVDGNQLKIEIKSKEKLIGSYYFKTKKEKERFINYLELGDQVKIKGIFKKPNENKAEHLFNYRKYLERRNIFYLIEIEELFLKEKNNNLFYCIKNWILKRTTNPYLRTFILGDTSLISKKIRKNYQELGISHLFAISGMHISLLSVVLLKVLKKVRLQEKKRYFLVSTFLVFYLFLVGSTPSVLRAVLFFILFSINKIYYFYIKPVQIFILVTFISILIHPNYIFEIAFLYSFSISLALILLESYINHYKSYCIKLLFTSLISFIVSIPITLSSFNQINLLSIFYNLIYVPLISIVIFPLSFLTFFIPKLEFIFNLLIQLLELSSDILNKITISKLIFCDISYLFYFIYIVVIIIFFFGILHKKYIYTFFLFFMLLVHYIYPILNDSDYLVMLDVGQGDSILLHSKNKNVLVDTGGNMTYDKERWKKRKNTSSIVENVTIPYLKKQGIKKIDILILTHGDFDHLGEAKNLIKNFKVEKILINEGKINSYEKELIKSSSLVEQAKANDSFKLGNLRFLSLNNDLEDENDSSLVFYIKSKNKKLLLMGDASIKSEENIMNKYQLEKVDILKVGHHGSRTSSSERFLKKVKPTLALISAGNDNKFGHPHKEVTNRFEKLGIMYLITSKKGSIQLPL